jgi:hypothetical protein
MEAKLFNLGKGIMPTEQRMKLDWEAIQDISRCQFDSALRDQIESNLEWYRLRSGEYADDASSKDFENAFKTLGFLNKSDFSRSQLEPIADELATVMWFLEVMAQAPAEKSVSVKYFLYFRIWTLIGKAGVKLTQGKGILNHRLSHAQKIFREVCRQEGIEFASDQALADALRRALKAMAGKGAK